MPPFEPLHLVAGSQARLHVVLGESREHAGARVAELAVDGPRHRRLQADVLRALAAEIEAAVAPPSPPTTRVVPEAGECAALQALHTALIHRAQALGLRLGGEAE